MTMKQKPKEKKGIDLPVAGGGGATGEGNGSPIVKPKSRAELKKVIADIAEEKGTLKEIQIAVAEQTGMEVTQPTIGRWLKDVWGGDYDKKTKEMRERKSNNMRWKRDFENARADISSKFHKDYLSAADGMFYDKDGKKLKYIPQMSDTERAYKKKDIIHFVREKMFGYSEDPADKSKPGVYDPAVFSIFRSEVRRRIYGLADDKFKRMVEDKFDVEREIHDTLGTTRGMNLDEQDAFDSKLLKDVRKSLVTERTKLYTEAEKDFKDIVKQVKKDGADIRSTSLLGKDLLDRHLCFDKETEILTFDGFKLFSELKGDEKVLTLNTNTGIAEYQIPTKFVKYNYEGKMYRVFNPRGVDLCVLPEHNMYVERFVWGGHKGRGYGLSPAKEIFGDSVRYKTDIPWIGKEENYFILPAYTNNGNYTRKNQKIKMDVWLKFFGYYLSEGHVGLRSVTIINCDIKPIEDVMKEIGWKYRIQAMPQTNINNMCYQIIIQNKQLAIYLQNFGKSYEKYIPRDILMLSSRQLLILRDAMMWGDGAIRKGAGQDVYYTSSKRLSNDFLELLLKTGLVGRINSRDRTNVYDRLINNRPIQTKHINYEIGIRKNNFRPQVNIRWPAKIEEYIDYNDMVYCVTVPNQIIYIKRNKFSGWSGNCPAFASSSKKFRGKQRMLTLKGNDPETGKPYVYSRVVYNIPFLLWNHPKRLQVMCVSDDSEILTWDGWKTIDTISDADLVATLNDNNDVEYKLPKEIIKSEYSGPMIKIDKGSLDILVTPNHRMWVGSRGGRYKDILYENKYQFINAEDLYTKADWLIPRSARPCEYNLKLGFVAPIIRGNAVDNGLWLEFMGIWLGDGNIWSQPENSKYLIAISSPESDKHHTYILDVIARLCKVLNISYQVYENDIRIWSKPLFMAIVSDMEDKTHSIDKFIPRRYLACSVAELHKLYAGLMASDGYFDNETGCIQFTTASKQLRDDFQELCFKLGFVATYRIRPVEDRFITNKYGVTTFAHCKESYSLSIAVDKLNGRIYRKDIEQVDYNGRIWCVDVDNHRIYVRRNGKSYWTGNSHNMAKDLPELLGEKKIVNGKEILSGGEKPIVKGKFDDIQGANLRVRMPRNPKEDILTREAGIVITEDVAERFRYFNIVERGTMIAESVEKFPETFRVNKPTKGDPFKKYKEYRAKVGNTLSIRRGDPLVFGGFNDLEGSPGYAEAKHSGNLVYIGRPKKKSRTITVDPDIHPSGKSKVEIEFFIQDYQIVREDTLRMGDKIISRNGLKGVVAEIVKTLGKNEKDEPYDAIVNYGEVWREADKTDPEYQIKEDTYIKQGKKKSGVVREHEDSDGKIFFFLIDKMAQDQSTSGLRMSTTMLSGMWEWFLHDISKEGKNLTQAELDSKLQNFVERYFGDKGTFIPSLKAMHYKAVKKGNKVRIEIDEREPVEDEDGKVIVLPHTYAGRTYEKAYIPNYISRIYFDGNTLREYYQTGSSKKGVSSASDWYWSFIVKQIKNRLYLFPRNEDAVNLVAVPIYNGSPEDYDTVVMDHIDYINAGGNPYVKNPTITLRKEPVTNKDSIQTHPVRLDFDNKFSGCIGIHPEAALKATIDYDGDQVVVFSPPIEHARVILEPEKVEELKATKKRIYDEKFEDLYKKARDTKYAEDEEALGVYAARYNQETAEIENTMIQELGGLRKRAILFYGAKKHESLKYGSVKDSRESPITPEVINRVCDVEKILKMREPRWEVKKYEQTPWDQLTDEQKKLVSDYHIRRELKRRLQKLIDTENLHRLKDVINKEKSFIDEDKVIDRAVDPINVEIEIGDRLIDRVIWQQIRGHKDILTEED